MAESSCDVNGYDWISEKIKEHLGLKKSPVALKFVLREDDIPEGIEKIRRGKEYDVAHSPLLRKQPKNRKSDNEEKGKLDAVE